jgi:hypothetical protein
MVALAGAIADGWLSHELCPPSVLRDTVLPALNRSGRSVDVVVSACCSVDPSSTVARRRAAGVVGFYASVSSYEALFSAPAPPAVGEAMRSAGGAGHSGFAADHAAMVAAHRSGIAADQLGHLVPDEMAAAFTLCGTADGWPCRSRLLTVSQTRSSFPPRGRRGRRALRAALRRR